MNIQFLATVAVIAPDPLSSRKLYVEALGLPLQGEGGGYYHSEHVAGCKSFGIWPLSQAAQPCFGLDQWPEERPVPQVSIEFDVEDAAAVAPVAHVGFPPDRGGGVLVIESLSSPALSCHLDRSRACERL